MGEQTSLFPAVDPIERAIAEAGLAKSTLRRYAGAVRGWKVYCAERFIDPLDAPTDDVIRWLDARMRNHSSESQLVTSLAAIRMMQRAEGGDRELLPYARGSRGRLDRWCATMLREDRARTKRRASPLYAQGLMKCIRAARQVRIEKGQNWDQRCKLRARDCAMLLVGWWGALRADELARMQMKHLVFVDQGVELRMPGAKRREIVAALARQEVVEFCPVRALQEYFHAADLRWRPDSDQKVFGLCPATVGNRVRAITKLAGLMGDYTGHSMRAGFASEAAAQDVPDRLVRDHARWRDPKTHAMYIREGTLWRDTPTTRVRVLPDQYR